MVSACWLRNRTVRKVFPEVKGVFFSFLSFFCPFGQNKMRQFAIVWLPRQSSCMWHWVHHTPLCGIIRTSLFSLSRYFWHSLGLVELGTKLQPTRLCWALNGWPPVFHSWFWVGSLFKVQDASVYHHSGPFIHKLAVLIQLRESSWTIQKQNSASSVNDKWDVVYLVRPEGGARHTSALNFTCVKEEVMIGHCQVILHHLSAVSHQIALRPKSP